MKLIKNCLIFCLTAGVILSVGILSLAKPNYHDYATVYLGPDETYDRSSSVYGYSGYAKLINDADSSGKVYLDLQLSTTGSWYIYEEIVASINTTVYTSTWDTGSTLAAARGAIGPYGFYSGSNPGRSATGYVYSDGGAK